MYSPDTMLERFAAGSVQTASGPKIVVMCFDRLDRDLATALISIARSDYYETNQALGHAQELLGAMADMLDVEIWDNAKSLLTVYDYVLRRLAQANATKDPQYVIEAQRLLNEIGDAFRTASTSALPATPSIPFVDFDTDPADRPRLSIQA